MSLRDRIGIDLGSLDDMLAGREYLVAKARDAGLA